ncbi:FAD-dependent oxidoreductase [Bacillus thuringiensis]|uniref:FAD-dependent oxidoreductase n=1 Tax=Bacillus thuringiensis TaxID=1428 RepID=UPI000BFD382A|nr:FAD-dependent oxidoreductase [Bacillus thuringiensis]MDA1763995.1 FAD-dependent oxidoreductase [Bacillus cereus]PGO54957.1 hypothetical protein CN986_15705 [Bacillus thuringiensis]
MNNYDVIIAGSGIIGKTIAFSLRFSNLKILVVDPSYKKNGSASLAAGAMLGVFGEVTSDKKSELDMKEIKFRLDSSDLYPEFIDDLENESGQKIYQSEGTFIIANTVGQMDRINIDYMYSIIKSFNGTGEWIDPKNIPNYKPNVNHEAYKAIYLPNEKSVSSEDMFNALDKALAKYSNISFLDDEVLKLIIQKDRIIGVETKNKGEIFSGKVVLSSGIGTAKILEKSNIEKKLTNTPKLLAGKGSSLIFEAQEEFKHVIRTPNRDFACGTHIVPRKGTLYVGATNRIMNTPGQNDGVTGGEIHSLLHSAIHEINTDLRSMNVSKILFGSRPITVDRYPLIGNFMYENLFIATGTYRNGIVMAPLIAKIIQMDLLGKEAIYDNYFTPGFRENYAKKDKSILIKDGVRDLVSFIQEPFGKLPYNRGKELESFLYEIMNAILEVDKNKKANEDIEHFRKMFEEYPMSEIIPTLYYQLQEKK